MSSNSKNRGIDRYGDIVFLWINNMPATYTDCANIMEPILELPIWSFHWKADGRIGAVVSKAGKEAGITGEPYIYQLRWAAEYYGARAEDYGSIAAALENMRKDFGDGKINIDHLDNNYRNCCLWNLAKMTRKQNAAKWSLTAQIYDPYFWFSVNTGNGYRILCGNDASSPKQIFCADVADYLEYLRRFCETAKEMRVGQRIGYDTKGSLTDLGERMIRYLREAPDGEFTQRQFVSIHP